MIEFSPSIPQTDSQSFPSTCPLRVLPGACCREPCLKSCHRAVLNLYTAALAVVRGYSQSLEESSACLTRTTQRAALHEACRRQRCRLSWRFCSAGVQSRTKESQRHLGLLQRFLDIPRVLEVFRTQTHALHVLKTPKSKEKSRHPDWHWLCPVSLVTQSSLSRLGTQ